MFKQINLFYLKKVIAILRPQRDKSEEMRSSIAFLFAEMPQSTPYITLVCKIGIRNTKDKRFDSQLCQE